MRLSVSLLRDPEAERRAKEKAEAPTVKTEEQTKRDEEKKKKEEKNGSSSGTKKTQSNSSWTSIWTRKFRPLPEAKAVDLFADVIGDGFILGVASAIILYEYFKAAQKPDANKERIEELNKLFAELKAREEELVSAEEKQRLRFESLEEALRALRDPKTKKPLLPSLQSTEEPTPA